MLSAASEEKVAADLEGPVRPQGSGRDLGAYEYQENQGQTPFFSPPPFRGRGRRGRYCLCRRSAASRRITSPAWMVQSAGPVEPSFFPKSSTAPPAGRVTV